MAAAAPALRGAAAPAPSAAPPTPKCRSSRGRGEGSGVWRPLRRRDWLRGRGSRGEHAGCGDGVVDVLRGLPPEGSSSRGVVRKSSLSWPSSCLPPFFFEDLKDFPALFHILEKPFAICCARGFSCEITDSCSLVPEQLLSASQSCLAGFIHWPTEAMSTGSNLGSSARNRSS